MLHFRLNTEQRHVLHVFSVSLYFDFFFLKETFGQLDTAALFQYCFLLLFSEKLLPILSSAIFSALASTFRIRRWPNGDITKRQNSQSHPQTIARGSTWSPNFHEVQISPSTYTLRTNSILEPSWTATSAYHAATPSLILQEISNMPFFHLVYHSRRASPAAAARAFHPPGEPSRRRGKLYRAMRQRPHR